MQKQKHMRDTLSRNMESTSLKFHCWMKLQAKIYKKSSPICFIRSKTKFIADNRDQCFIACIVFENKKYNGRCAGNKNTIQTGSERRRRTMAAPIVAKRPELLRFELPLPPSLNNAYVTRCWIDKATREIKSARVPSQDLLAFKEEAWTRLHQQGIWRDCWVGVEAVKWEGIFWVPDRKSDADNRIKFWQDAVSFWVGINDNRFEKGSYERRLDKKRPRVEIEMWPTPRWEPEK